MWCPLRKISAPKSEEGYTIVELMITIGIFTIVLSALIGVFISVQRSQAYVADRTQSLDNLRVAMDRLSKEVRQATVVGARSATSLAMTTFVSGSAEDVTWAVTGGTLTRTNQWGASTPLLRNVTNSDVFTYTPATGRPIVVTVRLKMRPVQIPDTVLELTSEIRLRNG